MNLYSYKGSYPDTIPFRITFSDGYTRTDPTTFTQEELLSAGYTGPYELPIYNSKIETVDWNGSDFSVRPYSEHELETQWNIIRNQRNELLRASDWTQIEDYNLGVLNKSDWAIYRQQLRDLPEIQSNPFDILWPTINT